MTRASAELMEWISQGNGGGLSNCEQIRESGQMVQESLGIESGGHGRPVARSLGMA
jgi:hypothetical protein